MALSITRNVASKLLALNMSQRLLHAYVPPCEYNFSVCDADIQKRQIYQSNSLLMSTILSLHFEKFKLAIQLLLHAFWPSKKSV
jgi:hypothetical protein